MIWLMTCLMCVTRRISPYCADFSVCCICDTIRLMTCLMRVTPTISSLGANFFCWLQPARRKKNTTTTKTQQRPTRRNRQPHGTMEKEFGVCPRHTCLNVQNAGNEPRLVTLLKMNRCTITFTQNGGAL